MFTFTLLCDASQSFMKDFWGTAKECENKNEVDLLSSYGSGKGRINLFYNNGSRTYRDNIFIFSSHTFVDVKKNKGHPPTNLIHRERWLFVSNAGAQTIRNKKNHWLFEGINRSQSLLNLLPCAGSHPGNICWKVRVIYVRIENFSNSKL